MSVTFYRLLDTTIKGLTIIFFWLFKVTIKFCLFYKLWERLNGKQFWVTVSVYVNVGFRTALVNLMSLEIVLIQNKGPWRSWDHCWSDVFKLVLWTTLLWQSRKALFLYFISKFTFNAIDRLTVVRNTFNAPFSILITSYQRPQRFHANFVHSILLKQT